MGPPVMHSTKPLTSSGRIALTILLAFGASRATVPLSAAELLCPGVTRVALEPRPAWVSSALWVPPPGGGILAVDSATNRLLVYSPDGKGRLVAQPEDQLPALLTNSGDHILLKLVGRDAVALDRRLEDSRAHSVLQKVKTPVGPLTSIWEWTGVDHSLLAVGLVLGKNLPSGYQAGLFRFSAEEGEKDGELVLPVTAWDYYVLGYDYLTSTAGGTGYFVDIEADHPDHATAHLYEVPPGGQARELRNAVPPEMQRAPRINASMYGPKDAPPLYEKLSHESMITGVHGGPDGNIYLLGRKVTAKGNAWWLYRVSPTGVPLGKALLPTHAKHISMVVSADTFFLIERGDLYPQGHQQINTMVTVPAVAVERAPLQGIEVCPGK